MAFYAKIPITEISKKKKKLTKNFDYIIYYLHSKKAINVKN